MPNGNTGMLLKTGIDEINDRENHIKTDWVVLWDSHTVHGDCRACSDKTSESILLVEQSSPFLSISNFPKETLHDLSLINNDADTCPMFAMHVESSKDYGRTNCSLTRSDLMQQTVMYYILLCNLKQGMVANGYSLYLILQRTHMLDAP